MIKRSIQQYPPYREEIGKVIRSTWVEWAKVNLADKMKPQYTKQFDELSEQDKEVNRLIGDAVVEYLDKKLFDPYLGDPTDTEIDHNMALSTLLQYEVIFAYPRKTYNEDGSRGANIIGLAVDASDVFMWACTELEPCTYDDIQTLYNIWLSDERFGVMKWVCKHRGMQPQAPIRRDMKAAGVWDSEIEALEKNYDDKETEPKNCWWNPLRK